jgi:hypothetical protein
VSNTKKETQDRCGGVEYTLDNREDVEACERHGVVEALRKVV